MLLAGRSVAVITERFPNLVQPYVLNHLISLKEAGARLTIVSGLVRENGLATHPLPGRVRYIGLNNAGQLALQMVSYCLPGYSLRRVVSSAGRIIAAQDWRRHGLKYFLKELAKLKVMSEGPFDLVHSHYLGGSYEYLFLKEVFGVPLVTTFHGLPPSSAKQLAPDKMAKVFQAGDLFLVNTIFARQQLEGLGCPAGKVAILPQGSDLSQFPFRERVAPPDERFILLSVARLSPDKGLKYAVRAVKQLVRRYPKLEYQIVGEGPEKEILEEEIRTLNVPANVRLVGPVSSQELLLRYKEAHAFLLPSIRARDGYHEETQGVVIQEAQATGLPVIATYTGGIPECVTHGETGLLVEERNPEALAQAIEHLIDDYDEARRLARAGRRFVEANFDQKVISQRLFELYEAVLRREPAAG